METLQEYLQTMLDQKPLKIILSNSKSKLDLCKKIVITKKSGCYQVESFFTKQVFHENINQDKLFDYVYTTIEEKFSQLNVWNEEFEYSLRLSKKGKILFAKKKNPAVFQEQSEHNRKKNYILSEGIVAPPLVDMGIMTKDGKIIKSMYDKYKQINRFIEMIDDTIKGKDIKSLNIIDFGCGKSYLTFVLYYYLHTLKNINVNMIGLDLKQDVIEKCNDTAQKYGYNGLVFKLCDIKDYICEFDVDMVISLHACDTATDFALFNAISWNAKMIFCVPCCQHELNSQIKCDELSIITRYGIVQERVSSLFTDAIRANLLEYNGYKTQLLEFIDIAHTPKNILIRSIKSNIPKAKKEKALLEAVNLMNKFNLTPTLYKLLDIHQQ